MNPADYKVRRATTDDMDALIALWNSAQLPAHELDKRFTEFQIVESQDGKLLGAIGLQICAAEGKLHSEAYVDFGLTDLLRPLLWERIEKVAGNNGLFRLWTDEPAPFWKKECGFVEAPVDGTTKFPEPFSNRKTNWLYLQLRENRAAPDTIDAEFARFKAEEKERTEKMFEQARMMRGVAWGLAILLFVFVGVGVIYLLKERKKAAATLNP